MNKTLIAILPVILLSACDGVFDGIYDEVSPDTDFAEGFFDGNDARHFTIKLDATNYGEWICLDLHNREITRTQIPLQLTSDSWDGKSGVTYHLVEGEKYTELSSRKTDPQIMPDNWDLAIHHFDVRTNRGTVAATDKSDIEEAAATDLSTLDFKKDVWTDNQVIVDLKEMMGFKIGYQNSYVNPVITAWAVMDFSTPPPVYSASGKAYILKMTDGSAAAIKMRSYMSSKGTKGYLTIDIIYPLD